jgi:hypothetical protein
MVFLEKILLDTLLIWEKQKGIRFSYCTMYMYSHRWAYLWVPTPAHWSVLLTGTLGSLFHKQLRHGLCSTFGQ